MKKLKSTYRSGGPYVKIFTTFFLIAALASCGTANQISDPKNIFGPDDRKDADINEPAYTAVGRIDSGCTGTLISPQLVLTAAHCAVDTATKSYRANLTYFRPNLRDGTSVDKGWVTGAWVGSETPEQDRINDWAVLQLSKPLGNGYAKIQLKTIDFASALPFATTVVGYSTDRNRGNTASVTRDCHVLEVNAGRLFNDCDSASGVSGGPLLNWFAGTPYIVGIAVSEFRKGAADSVRRDVYSSEYANVAVPGQQFVAKITQLINALNAQEPDPQIPGVIYKNNPTTEPGNPPPPPPPPGPVHPSFETLRSRADFGTSLAQINSDLQILQQSGSSVVQLAGSSNASFLSELGTQFVNGSRDLQQMLGSYVSTPAGNEDVIRHQIFAQYEVTRNTLADITGYPLSGSSPSRLELKNRIKVLNDGWKVLERSLFR